MEAIKLAPKDLKPLSFKDIKRLAAASPDASDGNVTLNWSFSYVPVNAGQLTLSGVATANDAETTSINVVNAAMYFDDNSELIGASANQSSGEEISLCTENLQVFGIDPDTNSGRVVTAFLSVTYTADGITNYYTETQQVTI